MCFDDLRSWKSSVSFQQINSIMFKLLVVLFTHFKSIFNQLRQMGVGRDGGRALEARQDEVVS